ncbi:EF-hand domain-containing protein [Rhizobium sp. SL86]|uniref:EF-hand domain-containing protein n=1 Tax=Rhizobium sp. SL86 TaxID=2995148 RepID=UPI002272A4BF|nr:EF-hand domain-containing protein [Rhizobium sp. SL86]MCY1664084.1 EF-hand domain-containing protein [Rhizobium sp. SL86]
MTSISSINNLRYDLKTSSGLQSSSLNGTAGASTVSTVRQGSSALSGGSDSADSNSALSQLMSALMSMSLNMTQTSDSGATSTGTGEGSGQDRLAELDADGDGVLSETEFLAGKPDDVTDDMASNLFGELDADGDGAISAEELAQSEPSAKRAGGPPPPPQDVAEDETDEETVDPLDTDGDGQVSEAEFLAGRPDDVTEEMATNLFSNLDTDGDGIISADELAAMKEQQPPAPMSVEAAEQSDDAEQSVTDLTTVISELEDILAAYTSLNEDETTSTTSTTV